MASNLRGRVIIITGASSGIGAATALACANEGMKVVLSARRADRLNAVAETIGRRGGASHIVVGDVTDPGMSERLLDEADSRFGRFDTVFANAGFGLETDASTMDGAALRRMFDVNAFASFDLAQRAARRLIDANSAGHLLMCSSCVARLAMPWYAAYCASKAAQHQLCRGLGMELKPRGIAVTSVLPVTTTTEFHKVATGEESAAPAHAPRWFVQPPERVAKAVVRCLKSPKPEVWTSHTVRFAAALMTMFPSLADWSVRKEVRRGAGNE